MCSTVPATPPAGQTKLGYSTAIFSTKSYLSLSRSAVKRQLFIFQVNTKASVSLPWISISLPWTLNTHEHENHCTT